MGSWLALRRPGVQARGLPHHFCSPMALITACFCGGWAQAEAIYSGEPRGHAAVGAVPLGDIQTGFEARGIVPKWVLGEDVPHKSARHPSGCCFSFARSSFPPLSAGSCALIGTFLSQRPLTPHPHCPPSPPPHLAGLGGGTARRQSTSEAFMEQGGRGRRRGLLQLFEGLRASLPPCRGSDVLVVGLSQSFGE